jgi:hypothetical protein
MLWKLLIWKTKDCSYRERENNRHLHISISRTRVRLFKIWLKHWWMKLRLNNFYSYSSQRRRSSWETHDKIRINSISTLRLSLIWIIRLSLISIVRLSSISTIRLSPISIVRLSLISTIRLSLISIVRLSSISTDRSRLETSADDKIQMRKMIAIVENQTIYENEI